MREIKFRAWDEETKQLLIVNSLTLDFGLCDLWNGKPEDEGVAKKLSDVNLMQYTGLKDKNGVEIYDGDVITYQEGPPKMRAKVVWKNGGFVFAYEDGIENITSESWYAPMDVEITEVIGNIYQNPELLT